MSGSFTMKLGHARSYGIYTVRSCTVDLQSVLTYLERHHPEYAVTVIRTSLREDLLHKICFLLLNSTFFFFSITFYFSFPSSSPSFYFYLLSVQILLKPFSICSRSLSSSAQSCQFRLCIKSSYIHVINFRYGRCSQKHKYDSCIIVQSIRLTRNE